MIGLPSVNSPSLPALYQAGTLLLLLMFSIYDIRYHRVRNAALFAFFPWCLIYILLCIRQYPQSIGIILFDSLLGFISGGLLLLTVSLFTDDSIGGGDIKLLALLGILYGTVGVITISVFASLAAITVYEIRFLIFKKEITRIPFVPYLFFGCLVTVFIFFRKDILCSHFL